MSSDPLEARSPGVGRRALHEGVRDARRAWSPRATVAVVAFVLAASAPLVVRSDFRMSAFAAGLYVALAAVGLNFAVGLGGLASLGQGAFVGVGAFGAALLRVKAGWDPVPAAAVGTAAAVATGLIVAEGAVRLRGAFVAVGTWVLSWLFAVILQSFPNLSGGSQGLALPDATVGGKGLGLEFHLSSGVHYEIALVLVGLALLAYWATARGPAGLSLAAVRQGPAEAAALGIDGRRLQRGAFVASAAIGGLAGSLWVQLSGVADVAAYGPLLSVELFVAVLIGGTGSTLGPIIGALVLLVIPRVADGLGSAAGIPPERFEPVVASLLLLVALPIGRGGMARLLAPFARGILPARTEATEPVAATQAPATDVRPLLADGLSKRYGGIQAVDDVTVELPAGAIHAVIGPNGSGKTTLLRLLAGTETTDTGRIVLGDRDLTSEPTAARVEAGVIRTLQRTTIFPELTAIENVLAGMTVRRRYGALRALFSTPKYRAEAERLRSQAMAILQLTTLANAAGTTAEALPHGEQRLLMVATALAAGPAVLLIDEPSAGMSFDDLVQLVRVLHTIQASGVGLLLVEHNLRLVRALAGHVIVMDAGAILSEGTPDEVARDPKVEAAYLSP